MRPRNSTPEIFTTVDSFSLTWFGLSLLQSHVSRIQSMRQNEDAHAARLHRLESQLNGAPHARISRTSSRTSRANTRETLEPPSGGQAYPSFPPPPPDDAREADVSSTASALSTLSSLSLASHDERTVPAEKERQKEEKEKESSGDEDSKRRTRSASSVSGFFPTRACFRASVAPSRDEWQGRSMRRARCPQILVFIIRAH